MTDRILDTIKIHKDIATDLYFEWSEAIDEFLENPTIANRRLAIVAYKDFNVEKTVLNQKIKDVWCKYE